MATDTQRNLPFSSIDIDELVSVFYRLSDCIAIHEVDVDEWDAIVDARIVWWNKHYEDIRTKKVEFAQSMMDSYFEPHIALAHVSEAWNSGHSLQLFEMDARTNGHYLHDGDCRDRIPGPPNGAQSCLSHAVALRQGEPNTAGAVLL